MCYHQVPVNSNTKRLLGFLLHYRLHKFLRASFGLRDVPPKFQKLMDIILADLKCCFSFLGDIIVYGSTKEEHDERLNAVLTRLQSNYDKCEFEKTNLEWLGLKLGLNEFAILENNLTSIAEMKISYNKQSLASALGLFSHYRKCLQSNYSSKASDLNNIPQKMLSSNGQKVIHKHSNAFKNVVCAEPLAMYNPLAKTIVTCDASKIGISGELSQMQENGDYKTVSFFSRSLQ